MYIIVRSPYTLASIYLRGTIHIEILSGIRSPRKSKKQAASGSSARVGAL